MSGPGELLSNSDGALILPGEQVLSNDHFNDGYANHRDYASLAAMADMPTLPVTEPKIAAVDPDKTQKYTVVQDEHVRRRRATPVSDANADTVTNEPPVVLSMAKPNDAITKSTVPDLRETDFFKVVGLVGRYAPESARVLPGVQVLTSDGEMPDTVRHLAQHLHTNTYLKVGIIEEDLLNPEGLYDDEYDDRSTRYIIINGKRVSTGRQIHANEDGLLSLPTFSHFSPFKPEHLEQIKDIAGVKRLTDIEPSEMAEISALATQAIPPEHRSSSHQVYNAIDALYLKMLADAVQGGQKLWIMNVEDGLFGKLTDLTNTRNDRAAGRENLRIVGDKKAYMGEPTVPIAMNPQTVARSILSAGPDDPAHLKLGEYLRACMKGADAALIPRDIRKLLESQGVELHYATIRERVAKGIASLDYITMGVITAYSGGRDLLTKFDPQFHGDLAKLMLIDISTGIVYSQGLSKMFRAKSLGGKAIGGAVMITFNVAPYAYFLQSSNGVPNSAKAVMGGLISLAVGSELWKRRGRKHKEEELYLSLQEPDAD